MLCLGIESSCDDTSVALVRSGALLDQVHVSQTELHSLFGGVVPEIASREHHKFLVQAFDLLLEKNNITSKEIDVVGVTRGPGLLGSLLVGMSFAKSFAFMQNCSFIGINHLHAHLLAYGLESNLVFPALGVLVSGGHTHLYRIEDIDSFILLGKTLDDAMGEAFDKAGKMLGLPYPAGEFIDKLAQQGRADPHLFPQSLLGKTSLDFSFSGVKTAMRTFLEKNKSSVHADLAFTKHATTISGTQDLCDLCASYTYSLVEVIKKKTLRALSEQKDIKAIVLAGGVAANSFLRQSIQEVAEKHSLAYKAPSLRFCTDNGAMIANLAYLLTQKGYYHDFTLECIPRGRNIPDDMLQHKK